MADEPQLTAEDLGHVASDAAPETSTGAPAGNVTPASDPAGGGVGAPATPTRAELESMRESDFEGFIERGLDVQLAQMEAEAEQGGDDPDADAAAGEDGVEGTEGEDGAEAESDAAETDETEAAADGADDDDFVGYDLPQSDGVEWGDRESGALRALMENAFESGVSQEQFNQFTNFYADAVKALKAADPEHAKTTRAVLAKEWGDATDGKMAAAKAAFQRAFPDKELREQLRQARLPDGKKLANLPEFLRFLADSGKVQQNTSVDGRIEAIRRVLRSNRRAETGGNPPCTEDRPRRVPQGQLGRGAPTDLGQAREARASQGRCVAPPQIGGQSDDGSDDDKGRDGSERADADAATVTAESIAARLHGAASGPFFRAVVRECGAP